jgi:hypothetical protein
VAFYKCQGSDKFVFSVTIMILFALTIWIPSASALPQHQQTSFDVKITDPAEGKQVVIGKNLTLLGTSNYNPTSNCGVFIIVDGIKPYQKTSPIGQPGGNDYSKWKYTLTPAYAGTIEEGNNRITAKLVCQANPATTFHNIYVTGMNVPKQHSTITPTNATVVHVSSNTSSNLLHPRPLINHLSSTMHLVHLVTAALAAEIIIIKSVLIPVLRVTAEIIIIKSVLICITFTTVKAAATLVAMMNLVAASEEDLVAASEEDLVAALIATTLNFGHPLRGSLYL